MEYPVSIDTLDKKLAWLIRQIELSMRKQVDSLIGKEGTPEWQIWEAQHDALACELGEIKTQIKGLTISGLEDIGDEPPETQLLFLLRQEHDIYIRDGNFDNADNVINQKSALIEVIKHDDSWDVK